MSAPFKSYSQAAQDRFVHAVMGGKRNGTYIEIGCCHPTELSNTYALEQDFGWTGIGVDNDHRAISLHCSKRSNIALLDDATKIDWEFHLGEIRPKLGPRFDYLSLDVDSASLAALENILRYELSFGVITIETDFYRFGSGPRDAMRGLLIYNGYRLVCGDVCSSDGLPYEDWWVDPLDPAIDLNVCEKLYCDGKRWTEIFPP